MYTIYSQYTIYTSSRRDVFLVLSVLFSFVGAAWCWQPCQIVNQFTDKKVECHEDTMVFKF